MSDKTFILENGQRARVRSDKVDTAMKRWDESGIKFHEEGFDEDGNPDPKVVKPALETPAPVAKPVVESAAPATTPAPAPVATPPAEEESDPGGWKALGKGYEQEMKPAEDKGGMWQTAADALHGAAQGFTYKHGDEVASYLTPEVKEEEADGHGDLTRHYAAGSARNDMRNTMRADNKEAQKRSPWAYGLSEVGGMAPAAIALGSALAPAAAETAAGEAVASDVAAPLLQRVTPFVDRVVNNGAQAAGLGFVSGTGGSEKEKPQDVFADGLDEAKWGGLVGGGLTAATGVAAPLLKNKIAPYLAETAENTRTAANKAYLRASGAGKGAINKILRAGDVDRYAERGRELGIGKSFFPRSVGKFGDDATRVAMEKDATRQGIENAARESGGIPDVDANKLRTSVRALKSKHAENGPIGQPLREEIDDMSDKYSGMRRKPLPAIMEGEGNVPDIQKWNSDTIETTIDPKAPMGRDPFGKFKRNEGIPLQIDVEGAAPESSTIRTSIEPDADFAVTPPESTGKLTRGDLGKFQRNESIQDDGTLSPDLVSRNEEIPLDIDVERPAPDIKTSLPQHGIPWDELNKERKDLGSVAKFVPGNDRTMVRPDVYKKLNDGLQGSLNESVPGGGDRWRQAGEDEHVALLLNEFAQGREAGGVANNILSLTSQNAGLAAGVATQDPLSGMATALAHKQASKIMPHMWEKTLRANSAMEKGLSRFAKGAADPLAKFSKAPVGGVTGEAANELGTQTMQGMSSAAAQEDGQDQEQGSDAHRQSMTESSQGYKLEGATTKLLKSNPRAFGKYESQFRKAAEEEEGHLAALLDRLGSDREFRKTVLPKIQQASQQ